MDELYEALGELFQLNAFRPGQEVAIRAALSGRDVLAVLPTGGGKSLIYQLPAMMLRDMTTLVVSPLVALMRDQAQRLIGLGLPVAYFEADSEESREQLDSLRQGRYRLVFIAPERLQNTAFRRAFAQNRCGLFAVDEAHCVSQWGHDFRPDYRILAAARRELQPHAMVALTATATPQLRNDLVRLLGLEQPATVVTGFDRPNIFFEVHRVASDAAKSERIARFLSRDVGAGIIYVGRKRDAEELSTLLTQRLARTIPYYHAGRRPYERREVQDCFMRERNACVVATNAFGMGIDRADLRWVIHYQMPGTLEAYYQEAGRAGRDGGPARAILLHGPNDRGLHDFFIENDAPAADQLRAIHHWLCDHVDRTPTAQWALCNRIREATGLDPQPIRLGIDQLLTANILRRIGDDPTQLPTWEVGDLTDSAMRGIESENGRRRDHKRRQLARIEGYIQRRSCRRQTLLDYFGDERPKRSPRCCDSCKEQQSAPPIRPTRMPRRVSASHAQIDQSIVSCVRSYPERLIPYVVAELLRGGASELVAEYAQHELFGLWREVTRETIIERIDALIAANRLAVVDARRRTLRVVEVVPSEVAAPPKPPSSAAMGTEDLLARILEIGNSGDRSGVDELVAALNDPSGNVRRLAASALGKLRANDGVVPLLQLLTQETGPQVRQYAIKALGRIGDPRAIPDLQRIADEPTEKDYNRTSANVALRQIQTNR